MAKLAQSFWKVIESKSLEYREGRSDKVYEIELIKDGQYGKPDYGFYVRARFGRRGSTLQEQHWPEVLPLRETDARKLFQSKAGEKLAKGYMIAGATKDFTVKPIADVIPAPRGKDYPPPCPQLKDMPQHQLCNVPQTNIDPFIDKPGWWMQPKYDGTRAYLRKTGNKVEACSRTRLPVVVSRPIAQAAVDLGPQDFIIDGEMCGDTFFAFDLLWLNGVDYRHEIAAKRLEMLEALIPTSGKPLDGTRVAVVENDRRAIRVTQTWITTEMKRKAFTTWRELGGEGVVFKDPKAPYQAGRPNSRGCAIKFKFTAGATVLVVPKDKEDGKRSVAMAVCGGPNQSRIAKGLHGTSVGTVTIPPNKNVPAVGALVEVRYLYAYREGSLIQPTYIGPRDDKRVPDIYDSLQFKEEPRTESTKARKPESQIDPALEASVPTETEPPDEPRYRVAQGELDRDPRDVACPICKVQAGSPCKRPSGHAVFGGGFHKDRITAALAAGIRPEPEPAPPVRTEPVMRMCEVCNAKLPVGADNKLPEHNAIGKVRCPAVGTKKHLTVPDVPELDGDGNPVVEAITKPPCLCGHPHERHWTDGPCKMCVCEIYEPDTPENRGAEPDENAHLDEDLESSMAAYWRVEGVFLRNEPESNLRPGDRERFADRIPKWQALRRLWNVQKVLRSLAPELPYRNANEPYKADATRAEMQEAVAEGELAVARILSLHGGKLGTRESSEEHAAKDVKRCIKLVKQRLKAMPADAPVDIVNRALEASGSPVQLEPVVNGWIQPTLF